MLPVSPPLPHDRDAASRWRERWQGAWADLRDEAKADPGPDPGSGPAAPREASALLDALFGNSPFLAGLAVREPATMAAVLAEGPDAAFRGVLAALAEEAPPSAGRTEVAAALRRAKRQGALVAGAADIAGTWDVGQVTTALSDLADATLAAAVRHLLAPHGRSNAGGTLRVRDSRDPGRGSGLIVLGMGKLGARELNYSSDVDLVILFDASRAYHGDNPTAFFVRIARDLVRLMEERNADGYVFRTDLRLRPDPAATPLAVSVGAAHAYYASLGQNWERAAMIKARPVAGDLDAGQDFLAELRPFIWRKHLDFAAIQDIHAIKRQIQAHRGGGEIAVAGHNLKLGRGGIREIEFFAQVQQLIWGGRDPKLRTPRTLDALAAIRRAGLLGAETEAVLARAYNMLRRIEHRLQMQDDRQTHALPDDAAALAAIATFSGYPDSATFSDAVLGTLRDVEAAYAALFEEAPDLAGPGSLVFTGAADDPATIATLNSMGFRNATGVASAVRAWHSGRPRATRSERARELLTELMPGLLAALSRQQDPDAAFGRFDAFLNRLPAGVQLLSLFQRNPALLDRIAAVFGAAPLLADHLASHPDVIEGLLRGDAPALDSGLDAALADCRYLEEAMDAVRRVVHERAFLIGAATLDGSLDVDQAGHARADLADAALAALLPRVAEDFAARHGRIARGGMVAVALGKLGGREMMAASDLDIIMVYDHPGGAVAAKGGSSRALTPPEYFGRLATGFVAAISAPSGAGKLFDVDMRLRPSGNKGPLAVSLEGFARYQAQEAWAWEHMALTRARVVAGPPALARRVGAAIHAVLTAERDAGKLRADAAALRGRIARDLPPFGPLDVKYRPGGLLELEFIAQVLQLVHAHATPAVLATGTTEALDRLAHAGVLDVSERAALARASQLFRTVQGLLRLTVGKPRAEADLPAPVASAIARAVGVVDLAGVTAQITACAGDVRAAFIRHVGDPAAA
ncbi:bifunctional [glutamine synthetase] adenylyltransferase/[glutamine synthetase]-adenylyl-L-tyrosine phosphorylase [Elioraea sp.]|uniref:bifunctional [glutamine synthetase] adenylyltransferase/[glutamine synthetase]-adenylyl-L-tyrosine phosphorylase n=1 Tax=Elioraea sp. TaxID=2185103 RepID=UPI0038D1DFA3